MKQVEKKQEKCSNFFFDLDYFEVENDYIDARET